MGKKLINNLLKKFVKFFDTSFQIYSDECYEIFKDSQKTQELIFAIENDQNTSGDRLPTRYKVYRVGGAT